MDRKTKIDLIKSILTGKRAVDELRPLRIAIAYQDPTTGDFSASPPHPTTVTDPEQVNRNSRLLKQAKTDPTITVIKVIRA